QQLALAVEGLARRPRKFVERLAVRARPLRDAECPQVPRQRRLGDLDAVTAERPGQLLLVGEAPPREQLGDEIHPTGLWLHSYSLPCIKLHPADEGKG